MRVWFPNIGELVIPPGSGCQRLRLGLLAQVLQEHGHEVVWWTSTFDHARKIHLFEEDTTQNFGDKYQINWIKSPGYQKHVSLERLIDHKVVARKFADMIESAIKPDIILCSLPILDLCVASIRYGAKHNVPVVIDIRDWWPDLFLYEVPSWARGILRFVIKRYFQMAKFSCKNATAITGVTNEYMEWGLKKADRLQGEWDRPFPLAKSVVSPNKDRLSSAIDYWDNLGISADNGKFIVTFCGSHGRSFDLEPIIHAARKLDTQGIMVQFVLAGNGDKLEYYRSLANGLKNIIFTGWVDGPEIFTLMRIAHIGLNLLPDRPDFLSNLNNKMIEYLSAGLPVVSCPKIGAVHRLLNEYNCGATFSNGDSNELVDLLIDLRKNPNYLKLMSNNAKNVYNEMFIAENVYKDMADYLRNIAADFHEKDMKKNELISLI